MKFLITHTILMISSVTFLLYLINNPNFKPIEINGEYNISNIATAIILITISIYSIFTLLISLTIQISKKFKDKKDIIIRSIKYSSLITIGLILVFVLNFFDILTWTIGIPILIVVLIATIII